MADKNAKIHPHPDPLPSRERDYSFPSPGGRELEGGGDKVKRQSYLLKSIFSAKPSIVSSIRRWLRIGFPIPVIIFTIS